MVLSRCTKIWEGGEAIPLTQEKREEILQQNKAMADKALRVLAAAYRAYGSLPDSFEPEQLEQELIFIGLTGMIDPVRPVSEGCRGGMSRGGYPADYDYGRPPRYGRGNCKGARHH